MQHLSVDWEAPWGLVSDAHGNPVGLAAALGALKDAGAKTFFFLGDAVGYLPLEQEVIRLLREWRIICIAGNHDAMFVGNLPIDPEKDRVYGIGCARARSSQLTQLLAGWPNRLNLTHPSLGFSVLMTHGSPEDAWGGYVYQDSDLSPLSGLRYHAIFLGQTHWPFVRHVEDKLVINVGSCGLPRDVGGLSACALYDPRSNQAQILRVPFDVSALLEEATRVASVHESVRACLARVPRVSSGRSA